MRYLKIIDRKLPIAIALAVVAACSVPSTKLGVRRYAGTAQNVPVIAVAPTSDTGLVLSSFVSQGFAQYDDYEAHVTLTGGTSTAIVVWVKDATGWAVASDTGNLGQLGGQVLPTATSYVFKLDNLGPFSAVIFETQTNTGGVTVSVANLAPIKDAQE